MDDFGVNIARSEYTKATARAEAAEADARECRAERARYGDMMTEKLAAVEAERDAARAEVAALRAALQSLVDGKSEFDIEYDTGMPADEARRIMDLAYSASDNSSRVAP